ncbi:MAG: CPBP family glutamic-type intramembrane protease [Candidatus Bipolaricaulia bacterium]
MRSIFFNARRMRSGWRILLFLALTYLLLAASISLLLALFLGLGLEALDSSDPRSLLLEGYLFLPLLLASWFMVRYIDRRPFASLGLSFKARWVRELLIGVAIGLGMGGLFLAASGLLGTIRLSWRGPSWPELGLLLFGFLLAAAFEETFFHGYPLQTLIEGLGVYPALFIISIGFSLLHRFNPHFSLIGSINIGLAGLLLALGYLKTRALWLPIGLHLSWNLFQVSLSLPVSGLNFNGGLFYPEVMGPELLSGGKFGPEGSLITTAAFALAITFLALTRAIRPSPAQAKLWQESLFPPSPKGLEL